MLKAIRFRLYPNASQRDFFDRSFGCARLVYNLGLAYRKEQYELGNKVGYSQTSALLTSLKRSDEYAFLNEVDSISLQQSLRHLDAAYKRFFRKEGKYPRFKSKHKSRLSYTTLNQGGKIRIVGRYIKLPKIGYVKVKQSKDIGKIHSCTISKSPSGKYFVSVLYEEDQVVLPYVDKQVGIDLGLSHYLTTSDGEKVNNPKFLEKSQKKLAREQRRLSRKAMVAKKEGRSLADSKNYQKQRIKVARCHEKVVNQRNDFLHKLSTKLIHENQVIAIESLHSSNMMKNHKLARSIGSVSWDRFATMLTYKAEWYDRSVIKVDSFFPSSQLCSVCGEKNPMVKDLSVRKWKCPHCGSTHDRDINAAINILNEAKRLVAS